MDKKEKLWKTCRNFIDKYKISCPESLMQVDHVNLALPDLVEEVCEIVGYYYEKD